MPNNHSLDYSDRDLRRKVQNIINGEDASTQEGFDRILREYKKTGDKGLRAKLIDSSYPLVLAVSRNYFVTGSYFNLEPEDVVSYGNIGLIDCIDNHYDPDRPQRDFTSYVSWYIRREIKLNLDNLGRAIRIPVNKIVKLERMAKARREYKRENDGYEPTIEELADASYLSVDEIKFLLRNLNPASLDAPRSNKDGDIYSLREIIPDSHLIDHKEGLAREELFRMTLERAHLTNRERELLYDRFGLNGNEALILKELGEKYGVTGERVRQKLTKIIKKIRIGNGLTNKGKIKLPYGPRD